MLQPNLASGDEARLAELHDQMSQLTRRVSEIRHQLEHLEEAQEELMPHEVHASKAEAGDTDDKPEPTPSDPEAPAAASSLTGPAIEQVPKPPSSLGDPTELEAAAKQLPWWRRPGE